jgi:hypothetical protein
LYRERQAPHLHVGAAGPLNFFLISSVNILRCALKYFKDINFIL